MLSRDGAGNRQAQSDAARTPVSRGFQTEEGCEYLFLHILRYARAIVFDDDIDGAGRVADLNLGMAAVARCIFREIANGAAQAIGPAAIGRLRSFDIFHRQAEIGKVVADTADQCLQFDGPRFLGRGFAACEGNGGFRHALKLVDGRQHFLLDIGILDEFRPQPERGERCPEIMADRGQHPGAIVDEAMQAFLHPVERLGRAPDVIRPLFGQRRKIFAAPQGFGRNGEPSQRARDAAGDEHSDERQDERRSRKRGERFHIPPAVADILVERRIQPHAVTELDDQAVSVAIPEIDEFCSLRQTPENGRRGSPALGGVRRHYSLRHQMIDIGVRVHAVLRAEIDEILDRPGEFICRAGAPCTGIGRLRRRKPETGIAGLACQQRLLAQRLGHGFHQAGDGSAAAEEFALHGGMQRLGAFVPGNRKCQALRDDKGKQGKPDELGGQAPPPPVDHSNPTSAERL